MVQRMTVIDADSDYVEFWPAGSQAKGEFRCADCGYGAIVTASLPRCPMCGCEAWETATWSPFRRSLAIVAAARIAEHSVPAR
jgi:hypothetical protein